MRSYWDWPMAFHILNEDAIHSKKQTVHQGFERKFSEKLITSLKFKQVVFCAEIVVMTWQPGFWNWKGKWPNLKRSLVTKLFLKGFQFYQGKEREGEEVRNVKLSYLLKTSFMTQSCVMTSCDGDWGEEKRFGSFIATSTFTLSSSMITKLGKMTFPHLLPNH